MVAGLVIASSLPAFVILLFLPAPLMPECAGGGSSGSPMTGCDIWGIDFNWLYELLTPALVLALFTVPLGLLVCLVGLVWPRSKPAPVLEKVPAEPAAVDAAVDAALADFRAGKGARTRCPDCAAVILLTYDRRGPRSGSTHVDTACACGSCDGAYEVLDRP